jgi:hypothetical protein
MRVYNEAVNVIETRVRWRFSASGNPPVKQRAATRRKRDGSVAELRLLRLVDRLSDYSGTVCGASVAPTPHVLRSIMSESRSLSDRATYCD